jgi:hypothetical protein
MIQRILHSRHFLACLLSAATGMTLHFRVRHSRKTISFCGSWPFAQGRPSSSSSTPTPSSSTQRLTSPIRSCFPVCTFSPSRQAARFAQASCLFYSAPRKRAELSLEVGSGKTASCIHSFAEQILAYRAEDIGRRISRHIWEVKGDFCGKVQEILARHRRAGDYVKIGS